MGCPALFQGLSGTETWPVLLARMGCQEHEFAPYSCERFVVTVPSCGDAPDGIKIICGDLSPLAPQSVREGWDIEQIVLRKLGGAAGQPFAYPGTGVALQVGYCCTFLPD